MGTVHVVGAGVAGLAAAARLARLGRPVVLYEQAPHAGGRCRSFFDPAIERTIDNGNHLLLGSNGAALAYLDEIGSRDSLIGPAEPAFPFVDLRTGARWTVRPNRGRVPWWILSPRRRVPDSRAADYLVALKLLRARPQATVADCLARGRPASLRFWEPLAVAVLNASVEEGAACLLAPVVRELFSRGGGACRPLMARNGLSQAFIDPALGFIGQRGAKVHLNRRLRTLGLGVERVVELDFGDWRVAVDEGESVVLAVTPATAASLVPGLTVPEDSRAIVNGHFILPRPCALPEVPPPSGAPLLGLIHGAAQWLFLRGDVAAVTVSAADALADEPAEALGERLWADVARALGLASAPLPPFRIIKEKRATFAQVPASLGRRPPTRTRLANLYLAGDWTDTGLPATIEGAILSGQRAAAAVFGG